MVWAGKRLFSNGLLLQKQWRQGKLMQSQLTLRGAVISHNDSFPYFERCGPQYK